MSRVQAPARISDHLTIHKAARYLGVSVNTLRAWDHTGKLTARRHPINGYRLYPPSQLDAVLSALRAGATP